MGADDKAASSTSQRRELFGRSKVFVDAGVGCLGGCSCFPPRMLDQSRPWMAWAFYRHMPRRRGIRRRYPNGGLRHASPRLWDFVALCLYFSISIEVDGGRNVPFPPVVANISFF